MSTRSKRQKDQQVQYNFEWDPVKARQNFRKHKISFERAAEIFSDPFAISIYDEEHSLEEDRWISIGKTKTEILVVAIHTFLQKQENQATIRIISARKATKKETKQYERK